MDIELLYDRYKKLEKLVDKHATLIELMSRGMIVGLDDKQPEPDEELPEAQVLRGHLIDRNKNDFNALTEACELVVQERASRESWTERARLMEDERGKERKRLWTWMKYYAIVEKSRDEARNERDRYKDVFEELVKEIKAGAAPKDNSPYITSTLSECFLDALEKRARGE